GDKAKATGVNARALSPCRPLALSPSLRLLDTPANRFDTAIFAGVPPRFLSWEYHLEKTAGRGRGVVIARSGGRRGGGGGAAGVGDAGAGGRDIAGRRPGG